MEEEISSAYQAILASYLHDDSVAETQENKLQEREGISPAETARGASSKLPREVHEVSCWSCKHVLPVTTENRGTRVKCPNCGTKQALPS